MLLRRVAAPAVRLALGAQGRGLARHSQLQSRRGALAAHPLRQAAAARTMRLAMAGSQHARGLATATAGGEEADEEGAAGEEEEEFGELLASLPTVVVEHPTKLSTREADMPERFAIIGLSGTQFKVTYNDLVVANLLPDAVVGQEYIIDNVLLVGELAQTTVGRPLVAGAKVRTFVEEITRDKKVLILKRRRKNHKSRRTKGFRRDLTMLRVLDIQMPGDPERTDTDTATATAAASATAQQ